MSLLEVEEHLPDGEIALPPQSARGHFQVQNVDFSYASGEEVLKNLSLEVQPGWTVGIVGATGAGKTSLIKLLLRLYDVSSGEIRLDGADLRKYRLGDLARSIALVSQDVFLFHGSVRENIAYGSPGASQEQIVAAAKLAEADEFIREFHQGYDTIVGERGKKLSGGQRQRISIARALLKDAPILILDEATSSVDNETEAAIQKSLARIAHSRTTIVIAHRLSTIRHADRIFVLSGGALAEEGTHEELIGLQGIYEALWRVQSGEAVLQK
jgi:ATP-binding cassette subfamily B protein